MSAENLLAQETHFAFGKNWIDYAAKIDEQKISQAMDDLRRLSGTQRLDGTSFLDIGCGSGLHSLAALRLGAKRVHGIDIDPDSVVASKSTIARFAPSASSSFKRCSVFDMRSGEFDSFDIVYAWGVLHHTGDMVRAITDAASLVKPGGQLYVALYRKTAFCGMWRIIKRWYSRAGSRSQKRAMSLYVFLLRFCYFHLPNALLRVRRGRSAGARAGLDFDAHVRAYGKDRGMNFHNDVHDWLGGYPYQSISPEECRALLSSLGLTIEREFIQRSGRYLSGLLGSGCDEYVFRRAGGG